MDPANCHLLDEDGQAVFDFLASCAPPQVNVEFRCHHSILLKTGTLLVCVFAIDLETREIICGYASFPFCDPSSKQAIRAFIIDKLAQGPYREEGA